MSNDIHTTRPTSTGHITNEKIMMAKIYRHYSAYNHTVYCFTLKKHYLLIVRRDVTSSNFDNSRAIMSLINATMVCVECKIYDIISKTHIKKKRVGYFIILFFVNVNKCMIESVCLCVGVYVFVCARVVVCVYVYICVCTVEKW